MARIDLGLVDGNFFHDTNLDSLEAAINDSCLAGEVKMYSGAAEPLNWKFLNGQVLVNAQGLYPDFWLVIPVAWKSGSNATLPNMAAKFPIGQDGTHVLGATGGANTHVLASGNLPAHVHTIDHDHPLTATGGRSAGHFHLVTVGAYPGDNRQFVVQDTTGGPSAFNISAGTGATISNQAVVPATSTESADHFHNLDLPNFTGNSGNGPGGANPVDHTPAWVAFNYMIKVH